MDATRLTWFGPLRPVTQDAIEQIERLLGISFPEDYRSFALRYQGGIPDQNDFPLEDPRKTTASVSAFLSTNPERGNHYILATIEMLSGSLPKDVVPIAAAFGGDYVCFDFRRPKTVVVYWHYHRARSFDEFTYLAETFSDFIDLIYEPRYRVESKLD